MGPILSMLHVSVMHPYRLTRPNVGRKPVAPQRPQGAMMLPSVSLPRAKPTRPAAAAQALPAEEPLEPSLTFQGLRVMVPNHLSPCASAPRASLATRTAPASSNRAATVALVSIVCSLSGVAPQVVLYPGQAMRSFAPQGMPCN